MVEAGGHHGEKASVKGDVSGEPSHAGVRHASRPKETRGPVFAGFRVDGTPRCLK